MERHTTPWRKTVINKTIEGPAMSEDTAGRVKLHLAIVYLLVLLAVVLAAHTYGLVVVAVDRWDQEVTARVRDEVFAVYTQDSMFIKMVMREPKAFDVMLSNVQLLNELWIKDNPADSFRLKPHASYLRDFDAGVWMDTIYYWISIAPGQPGYDIPARDTMYYPFDEDTP